MHNQQLDVLDQLVKPNPDFIILYYIKQQRGGIFSSVGILQSAFSMLLGLNACAHV